jgi:tRNA G10  N-methylase Trm11
MSENKFKYAFVLGRYPDLSAIEILTVLNNFGFVCKKIEYSVSVLIVETDKQIEVDWLIEHLGGTIKIVKIIDEISTVDMVKDFENRLKTKEFFLNLLNFQDNKIHFGISFYAFAQNLNLDNIWSINGLKFYKMLKSALKLWNIKSGFVLLKEPSLSSVSVEKNKLIKNGFELVFILNTEKTLIGSTESVQPFEDLSDRDYGRPQRDSRSGMLPPKLAKIMLNIGGLKEETVLLDPFCGSGTILQEAVLEGCRNITGSDLSGKAVEDSKTNLDWLFEKNPQLKKNNYTIRLLQESIDKLQQRLAPLSIDLIATEPYLGSAKARFFELNSLEKEMEKIGKLYLTAFTGFTKYLKQNGTVVMVFPVYLYQGKKLYLNIIPEVEKIGFRIKRLDDFSDLKIKMPDFKVNPRGSSVYGRDDQTILREIFLFKRD